MANSNELMKSVGICVLCIGLTACATDDPNRRAKQGAVLGGVAGAVLGKQLGGDSGRLAGVLIGGLVGGAAGNYMDNQQRQLEAELAAERQAKQIEIQRLQDETLKVSLNSEASFAIDSAEVRPGFQPALDKLASTVSDYDKTILHIVGHTDNTGSETYNLGLSQRRAKSVAVYLQGQGVSSQRMVTSGEGMSEPRAPNDSAENRALNRRVEIFIKPIVEGQEQEAVSNPYS